MRAIDISLLVAPLPGVPLGATTVPAVWTPPRRTNSETARNHTDNGTGIIDTRNHTDNSTGNSSLHNPDALACDNRAEPVGMPAEDVCVAPDDLLRATLDARQRQLRRKREIDAFGNATDDGVARLWMSVFRVYLCYLE